jgi:hypothetical protein
MDVAGDFATLTWLPNLAVLGLGQLSLWPLFGFTGWLWCTRRGWRVTGSVCLVLMVIKPHLGLVLGFFALGRWYKQKDWLSLVTFTGSLIALTLVTVVFRSTIWSEYLASLQSGKAPTDFHTATLECPGSTLVGKFIHLCGCSTLAGGDGGGISGWHSFTGTRCLIACCLAIMTVPYAFSFDMVLLLPAWILALCFYFERAPRLAGCPRWHDCGQCLADSRQIPSLDRDSLLAGALDRSADHLADGKPALRSCVFITSGMKSCTPC